MKANKHLETLTHADVPNPRNLSEHMPGVAPFFVAIAIAKQADFLIRASDEARNRGVAWSEREAARYLVAWYRACEDEVEAIRELGLAEWSVVRSTPFVWATLEGLKASGIKDLPL